MDHQRAGLVKEERVKQSSLVMTLGRFLKKQVDSDGADAFTNVDTAAYSTQREVRGIGYPNVGRSVFGCIEAALIISQHLRALRD